MISGANLPWVLLGFTVLTGGSPVPDLCGLAAAHCIYFAVEVLPLKNGKSYLHTPDLVLALSDYITGTRPMPGATGAGAAAAAAPGRHNWGQGNRLG